ncbi:MULTISPECIES: hypothetical protein [unclassified Microcoleus]|nr:MULTISPECIES: hypothetical protein [unclassified Microcoleus]MCC3569816.1 hypothetical protein [Microcoleus sp. PH2017_31_RDM_U_A]MCC3582126.1 hypothetical protein [Microcoleus sp. PH2017_32_RDM_D_A]MCC3620011.1 hypothetical protein [Microcoleus sp. PH2017_38_RDM_U_B]
MQYLQSIRAIESIHSGDRVNPFGRSSQSIRAIESIHSGDRNYQHIYLNL